MAEDSTLLVSYDGPIVTLTLNRPDRANALAPPDWGNLLTALRGVGSGGARSLVLTGAGPNFCAGGDLDVRFEEHLLLFMQTVKEAVSTLHRLPIPTVAKVRGAAAGGGMNLALACDLVVAAEGARFSQIFVKRGLSVDVGGSWTLPRLIGLQRAKELVMLGRWVEAEEAVQMGLINRIVPDDQLDGFVREWALQLAAGPPIALNLNKSMLNNSAATTLDQALEHEAQAQAINFGTKDLREAYDAYRENRSPLFQGH